MWLWLLTLGIWSNFSWLRIWVYTMDQVMIDTLHMCSKRWIRVRDKNFLTVSRSFDVHTWQEDNPSGSRMSRTVESHPTFGFHSISNEGYRSIWKFTASRPVWTSWANNPAQRIESLSQTTIAPESKMYLLYCTIKSIEPGYWLISAHRIIFSKAYFLPAIGQCLLSACA